MSQANWRAPADRPDKPGREPAIDGSSMRYLALPVSRRPPGGDASSDFEADHLVADPSRFAPADVM
jgi:hypothetical protein